LALATVLPLASPALLRAQGGAPARRTAAAAAPSGGRFDTTAFAALRWRELGPARGGRSVAAAGSVQRPLEYWMGTTGGGVFKTTDGGMSWQPVTDKYFGGTIGAITVDPTNPDVVYVGGGETDIRGNTSHGDGLWKTTDGGKTWSMLGFKEEYISTIRVHPKDANTVYLGVFGRVFSAHPDRGVYKSTDGGKSFRKILFVNDSTGAIDLVMDPSNPTCCTRPCGRRTGRRGRCPAAACTRGSTSPPTAAPPGRSSPAPRAGCRRAWSARSGSPSRRPSRAACGR
jgi:hypothetical protein